MRTLYWPNGKRIKVIVLPGDHPLHKQFVKENLHIFPHQLRRAWNRKTYTGTGQAPITVGSMTEMQKLVNQTKNSIGYIDKGGQNE
jgi:ABC-type phosphate transport system substrate-binding protein